MLFAHVDEWKTLWNYFELEVFVVDVLFFIWLINALQHLASDACLVSTCVSIDHARFFS